MVMLRFILVLCMGLIAFGQAAKPVVKKPPAAQGTSSQEDKAIEAKIQAKLEKSKIGKDGIKVHVQGGVATWEGTTEVLQHKGAATRMAKLNWGDTKVVAIPTVNPQWAGSFLHDTGFKQGVTSLELDKLKKAFPFVDPPYGVALVDGQVKETFTQAQFNEPLPQPDLKKLGFVK